MEDDLKFRDLQEANGLRCESVFHGIMEWSPTDWACAMAGECGEACNLIKKLRRGDSVRVENIGKELADIVIYADLLAARLGLSLETCVRDKFNEVSHRRNYAGRL